LILSDIIRLLLLIVFGCVTGPQKALHTG